MAKILVLIDIPNKTFNEVMQSRISSDQGLNIVSIDNSYLIQDEDDSFYLFEVISGYDPENEHSLDLDNLN